MAAQSRRLKRAIIKEEYIAIAGDVPKAVILNQFIYWSERVADFDTFIAQENKRAAQHGIDEIDYSDGWIYKTAAELSEETMLGLSAANMRSHIKALIEKGFVSERSNPKYKWDRTKQYRVNLVEIVAALHENGYSLEGYKTELPFHETKNHSHESENHSHETENQNPLNVTAIPETTTETITETTTENKSARGAKQKKKYSQYEPLNNAIYDFIEFRKGIKKPMTERAIELLMKNLNGLSESLDEQVEIINQSIVNGWQGVFPLKREQTRKQYGQQQQPKHGTIYGRKISEMGYNQPNKDPLALDVDSLNI